MKKKLIMIAVAVCMVLGFFVYDQTRFKEEDIVLELSDMETIEYGETFNPLDLVKFCSGKVGYLRNIDTKKIGKHTMTFVVTEQGLTREFIHEIEVKDSYAPEITLLKDQVDLKYGEKFDAKKNIESVVDCVDGDIPYSHDLKNHSYIVEEDVDVKKSGDYQVKIKALDKNGNQTEKSFKVKVEKEVVKKPEVPSLKPDQPDNSTQPPAYVAQPNNRVIVIDPGHQGKGNSQKEAIGPGSSTTKAKVSSGATGVASRIPESQINLEVALKLRAELQARGYTVVMTRTSQDVNISNQQRASIGNDNHAAAVIHLHCDGGPASARGAHSIAIAKNNPYCPSLYNESSRLAKNVIESYTQVTGIKNRGVSYRNDLTGLNWSQVPSIYLEMGFISNETEDLLLTDSTFQNKCVKGIADGLDKYFQN